MKSIFFRLMVISLIITLFHNYLYAQTTIKDIDGNIYPTIKIGKQVWMAKNLAVKHYQNGEEIVSYCYHHDTTFCNVYGRLYPWESIVGGTKGDSLLDVCPINWHVPTDKEWDILIDTLGGQVYAGIKLRKGKKTNFKFQWGGNYQSELDVFSFIDRKVYFWSSTGYSRTSAWMRMTGSSTKNINRSTVPKEFAFSIRCVKD